MDWRTDANTRDIGDEFMFGPSILVSPVLQANASRRTLYLPESAVWYDFWTGAPQKGGVEIDANAPLDRIPLYVRAGSILPLGPEIQYADEKPMGPIDLRIYRGADGKFDLYQDAGDSYDYEKGAHALIPLQWSEATRTLTIGERHGNYPEYACEPSVQRFVGVCWTRLRSRCSPTGQDNRVHGEGNFCEGAVRRGCSQPFACQKTVTAADGAFKKLGIFKSPHLKEAEEHEK